MSSPARFCWLGIAVAALAPAPFATAQSVGLPTPRLLTVVPSGGKVGTEFELTVTGEHLDDAGDLVFSDRRVTARRKPDAPDRYTVKVAADCPPGLVEARVLSRLGLSSPRIFTVGTLPEMVPAKPNRSAAAACDLPLNTVCTGHVADRSIDFYRFEAKRGQRLIVECATRGVDSKLNATVILADESGRDIRVERRGGVIDFDVPTDGRYLVKIHELTFKGGPAFFYRLAVRELPKGAAIDRHPTTQPVNAFSWPPAGLPAKAASDEVEPNDTTPQKIQLPCDIAGRFFPAADVDVFEFDAKMGDEWWIEVASERLGLPTDPAVVIQRVNGTELVDVLELSDIPSPVKVSSNGYAYDGPPYNPGSADVLGKLTIPETGTYRLRLTDLFGGTRTDPRNAYRLVIRKAAPDFALVGWPLHMELRNGDRNAVSKPVTLRGGATTAYEVVTFRRDGFDGDIELSIDGLPPGVTAAGLTIPAGQSRGLMLVTAKPDAPRGYANVSFTGRATIAGQVVTRPCRIASMAWPVLDHWQEIPSPRLLADVPVSVSGVDLAPLSVALKAPVIEAKPGEKLTLPVALTRRSEYSGNTIAMKLVGPGFDKLPAFDLPLSADSADVSVDLKSLNVPPGEYRVAFLGGGVVKYRHRPELVADAETKAKAVQSEVAALEAEVKKLTADATAAPPEKKAEMTKALATMTAKMKAVGDALTASKAQLQKIADAAKPRDIVDIVVCEPFTIRVLPREKK